jgi:hypothetical protein
MSEHITRRSLGQTRRDRTDWERIDRLSDAEIEAGVAADPDAPPIADKAWFKDATLVSPEP